MNLRAEVFAFRNHIRLRSRVVAKMVCSITKLLLVRRYHMAATNEDTLVSDSPLFVNSMNACLRVPEPVGSLPLMFVFGPGPFSRSDTVRGVLHKTLES